MGQQKTREKPEQEKEDKKEQRQPSQEERGPSKKWKGKDWFSVIAPKMFGEVRLADTPAMDPDSLMGRNLEMSVSDLMGQPGKYYMKIFFKVTEVDSRNAYTRFNGYSVAREHLSRMVRKRNQKVESVDYFSTKDGWKIQVTSIAMLNRNTESEVQKKVRRAIVSRLEETAKKSGVDDILKKIIEGSLQKEMKKIGSKIYPVRFFEVAKIEVVKAPGK